MPERPARTSLPPGSLDLLLLRSLTSGPRHGYAVARHLSAVSDEFIRIEEGSLYPALHRLERRGWISSCWGPSESNRKAKFYELTAAGRKQLAVETAAWQKMQTAILRVLNYRPAET